MCSTFLVCLFIFYFFPKESHSECVAVSTVTTCHITITIAAFRWQLRLFNHRFPPSCPSQAGLQATASTGRGVGGWRGGGRGQNTVEFAGRKKNSRSHGREAWELLSLSDRSQPAAWWRQQGLQGFQNPDFWWGRKRWQDPSPQHITAELGSLLQLLLVSEAQLPPLQVE